MNSISQKYNTQLTPNGLYCLLECQKKGVILQVILAELLPERKPGTDSLKYKVVVSDGSAKHKAVLGNRAAFLFQKVGAPSPCIIRVDDTIQLNGSSSKRLLIIKEMEILDRHQNQTVGFPIDYNTWSSQNSFYENTGAKTFNLNTQTISSMNTEAAVNIMEYTFPREEVSSKKSTPFQILRQPRQEKPEFNKLPSPKPQDPVNNLTIFNTSPVENKKSQARLTSPSGTCSTAKSESDSAAQRAMKQINSVSLMGMQLRDFDVGDLQGVHKATDKGQAFIAEFFDKDGNKMSAMFYGENAEHFMSLFNRSGSHVVTNLGGGMEFEK